MFSSVNFIYNNIHSMLFECDTHRFQQNSDTPTFSKFLILMKIYYFYKIWSLGYFLENNNTHLLCTLCKQRCFLRKFQCAQLCNILFSVIHTTNCEKCVFWKITKFSKNVIFIILQKCHFLLTIVKSLVTLKFSFITMIFSLSRTC